MNWQPTCELRWLEYLQMIDDRTGVRKQKLQQKWVDVGYDRLPYDEEWRDVPVEEEA